jgi:hypothetical protein
MGVFPSITAIAVRIATGQRLIFRNGGAAFAYFRGIGVVY